MGGNQFLVSQLNKLDIQIVSFINRMSRKDMSFNETPGLLTLSFPGLFADQSPAMLP